MLADANINAQGLYNGDFSINTCNNITSCGNVVSSPCVANWIHVVGAPIVAPDKSIVLRGAFSGNSSGPGSPQVNYGPGSQAIAAGYNFVRGEGYTVTLDLGKSYNECYNTTTTLEVWAASGIVQPNIISNCVEPRQSTSGYEQIGVQTFAAREFDYSGLTVTFNYCAQSSNSQILILVYQSTPCQLQQSSGLPPTAYDGYVGLVVDLQKVTIDLTPCASMCNNSIFLASQSGQISSGGLFQFSGIKAGSSVAGTSTTPVSPPSNRNTIFTGDFVQLASNFTAIVDNTHNFEVIATNVCTCLLENPIVYAYNDNGNDQLNGIGQGGTLQMLLNSTMAIRDGTLGGVWSSDNSKIGTINEYGVITSYSSGTFHITYTVNGCSATITIIVLNKQGRMPSPSNNTKWSYIQDSLAINPTTYQSGLSTSSILKGSQNISLYPNPAHSSVMVTYPCNADGQLDIDIKDIAGRTMYMESVACNEGSNVQHSIDISTFTPGVYFVNLTINDQHVVKKLVKL